MISLEQAQERILSAVSPLDCTSIPLEESAGHYLARDIASPISLPPFDNSAMDGFAVRASDVAGASASEPKRLRQIAAVPAGQCFTGSVEAGTCVRLFTGSPLPEGADAVVMQEDTNASGDEVQVFDAVKPWENVRLLGVDVKAGNVIAPAGERITAGRIALLGAVGLAQVPVFRRPRVAILSTGNELSTPGDALQPGTIYESNRAMLAALAVGTGMDVRVLPIVRDVASDTVDALRKAFDTCDAVITSGGVSVGEHDLVKAAFESLGGKLEFWKVAVKPGKPFVFGTLEGKFLFGLPGNPVSAFVTFLLLARPALMRLSGARNCSLPAHPAILGEPVRNPGDRRHFLRVHVDEQGQVRSSGMQTSHVLSSLAAANALMDVPPEASLSAGTPVSVLRWGG